MKNKCKTCIHFTRSKWHETIDSDETYQLGGYCSMLKEILMMNNSKLWSMDALYVQESFGCVLHKKVVDKKSN